MTNYVKVVEEDTGENGVMRILPMVVAGGIDLHFVGPQIDIDMWRDVRDGLHRSFELTGGRWLKEIQNRNNRKMEIYTNGKPVSQEDVIACYVRFMEQEMPTLRNPKGDRLQLVIGNIRTPPRRAEAAIMTKLEEDNNRLRVRNAELLNKLDKIVEIAATEGDEE